jgi:hypothetical protein
LDMAARLYRERVSLLKNDILAQEMGEEG